jgi:hypothetical protein
MTQSSGCTRRLGNVDTYVPVPALLFHVYVQIGPTNISFVFVPQIAQTLIRNSVVGCDWAIRSRFRMPAETRYFSLPQNHTNPGLESTHPLIKWEPNFFTWSKAAGD